MTPDGKYPVWRIVISQSNTGGTGTTPSQNDVRGRLGVGGFPNQFPDSSAIEPEQCASDPDPATSSTATASLSPTGLFSMLPNPTTANALPVKIDRIIWLANQAQPPTVGTTLDANRIYFNRGNAVTLPGGQYLVLGPRATTYIGLATQSLNNASGASNVSNSPQVINLSSPSSLYVSSAGSITSPYPASPMVTTKTIKPPLTMIVAGGGGQNASYPKVGGTTWSQHPGGVGISISEPIYSDPCYYPEPTVALSGGPVEWYGNPAQTSPYFLDHPLETYQATTQGWVNTSTPPLQVADTATNVKNRPLVKENLIATGTHPNYKTAILQRLANPGMPYDPVVNPYRTVDWMPIDLTVFNGDDQKPAVWPPAWWAPASGNAPWPATAPYGAWDWDDPTYDPTQDPPAIAFVARQRGNPTATDFNIWAQVSADPIHVGKSTAGSGLNFPYDLFNTLGYLNTPYWQTPVTPSTTPAANNVANNNTRTDGPTMTGPAGGTFPAYIGDPIQPFPWITWNNRPYMNQLELLQVPSSAPGRLLWEFQFPTGTSNPNPSVPNPGTSYPHLLDFGQQSVVNGTTPLQLHRILDYVGVPSRFVGTETFINPNTAVTGTGNHSFHPPFNRIPAYREPGKININTIYTKDVFDGLMNYFPGTYSATGGSASAWGKFVLSRRGNIQAPLSIGTTDPMTIDTANNMPTRFGNPFRSFAGHDMTWQPLQTARELDVTLLRADQTNPSQLLFQFDSQSTTAMSVANQACMNSSKNSFFHYEELQRLGNLITTRSNVYAVWITVGYFQVTPNNVNGVAPGTIDAGHPDGYQLGPELGSDTGEVERHRAFYIYDRTIPVGFQRGLDLNVEKGLLLRRYIE